MSTPAIRIGVIGVGGRGRQLLTGGGGSGGGDGGDDFAEVLQKHQAIVAAVCDSDAAALRMAQEQLGAAAAFTAYDELLASGVVDAVVLATPMHLHVSQAVAALDREWAGSGSAPWREAPLTAEDVVGLAARENAAFFVLLCNQDEVAGFAWVDTVADSRDIALDSRRER